MTATATDIRARRAGFTLVELMVVLLVTAILAGGVWLSLAGPERAARMDDAIGQIEHYDGQARTWARQSGRALRLVADVGLNRVECVNADGHPEQRALELPPSVRLTKVMLADGSAAGGQVSISCTGLGVTPTYAMGLEEAAGQRAGVLVMGLTGQALRVDEAFLKRGDDVLRDLAQQNRNDAP